MVKFTEEKMASKSTKQPEPSSGKKTARLVPAKRIVLFDDTEGMARRYTTALSNAGYDVLTYLSAKEFLEAIESKSLKKPDLFVVDVMVSQNHALDPTETENGDLEGVRLAQIIRRTTKYSKIPIVLLSHTFFREIIAGADKAADEMTDKNYCDCVFVKKNRYTPIKFPALVKQYFKNGRFPKPFIKRITLSFKLPLFSRLKLEYEPES